MCSILRLIHDVIILVQLVHNVVDVLTVLDGLFNPSLKMTFFLLLFEEG